LIEIIKNQLDFGLLTRERSVVDFWQNDIGLPLDHVLPVRRGQDQYRFDVGGSVIKVNLVPDFRAGESGDRNERSGYDALWIATSDIDAPRAFTDPDGNRMQFVPAGDSGVTQIGVRLRVRDLERSLAHYRDVLGFESIGEASVRCGESVLMLVEDADAPTDVAGLGLGWGYLTVQVRDCDAEVARVEELGARVPTRPITLGQVARMAMVSDPDGNLLEISQRASLTGEPLPPNAPNASKRPASQG
jgi:catechol 2,3-dioxygenase-like lactoylglutathione lyase family enzyme